ncbi:hypothetical protein RI129_011586 [Pyrocoelia pectoralis]|uniref:Uncharacterized protein n=1 Tax=Pyrocoelia pectoralis TaxID=417401 RepID=A0AAN7V937_9COLE
MVNIPKDSPIPLIEFELTAFKNALALQSSSSNSKRVLMFPYNLDPIINRLIRVLASRLQLKSTLVGNYPWEVVLIYGGNDNRGEQDQITLEDVIVAKSLGVSGSQQTREIEAQPSTSSVPSSILAALDLPTKKGDGGVESHLKPSTSSTKSFESGEQPPDSNVEQSAHGKQKGEIKLMESTSLINLEEYTLPSLSAYSSFSDSMMAEKLSMSKTGISSPPMNLDETTFQSFSDDPSPPDSMMKEKLSMSKSGKSSPAMNLEKTTFASLSDDPASPKVTSTPQERTYTIEKPPKESSWTEDWGSHEVILLPSGYMSNIAPELLSVLTDRVPGTVCYCDKRANNSSFQL